MNKRQAPIPYADAFVKMQKWIATAISADRAMVKKPTEHTRDRARKIRLGAIRHYDRALAKLQQNKILP